MELRDYLDVVRSRKWIVIQALVVITAFTVVFSYIQPPVYLATAKVLIAESPSLNVFSGIFYRPTIQSGKPLETQIQLIQLFPVAEKVIKQLGLSISPDALLNQIDVRQVGETNLVEIKVRDSDPRKARDIANAFTQAYANWSEESRRSHSRRARRELSAKVKEIRGDILFLGKKISEKGNNQVIPEDLKIQLDLATNLYVMLSEKLEQLKIDETMQSREVELVAPARIPKVPISPKPVKNGVSASLVGLIFGLGLAFLVDHLDNTIKTPDDIDKCFGLPLLGQIPIQDVPAAEKKEEKIVSYFYPQSNAAEAYRSLRTSVQYLNFDKSIRCLTVTSGSPKEGKTTVLANLAVTLAQAGRKVVVICCDLRRSSIHKMFDLDNSRGLSNVLAGEISFEEALENPGIDGLRVLPGGPLPPNPSELLGSKKMQEVIEKAKAMSDIVLIDTPPALAVTDCAVVAPKGDGVVLVASAGRTTKDVAKRLKSTLENVDARLLGVVLNNVPPGKKYGYYYYYYYSGDGGKGEKERRAKKKEKQRQKRKRSFSTFVPYIAVTILLIMVAYIVGSILLH